MKKQVPRVLLAAMGSGSGKTTITCGLLKAWQDEGIVCRCWKCGPDYIDPMFHKKVLGTEGGNLDSFFLNGDSLKRMMWEQAEEDTFQVIEGVMGYYDGMGGVSTWASTYEIGVLTDTPVILIADGKGMSLSVLAMIRGFLSFRRDHRIKGIILNRTSLTVAQRLRPLIEKEGVELIGSIPDAPDLRMESRHLGLVLPGETKNLDEKLEQTANLAKQYLDLKRIYEIGCQAPHLRIQEDKNACASLNYGKEEVFIAVAEDEAFCFYYQENRRLLEKMGARLIPFSPLHDRKLPKADGLILGGGYPELYARQLSEQRIMREQIRCALSDGMPVLAECGGFLYLHEELEDQEGVWYPMAGTVKAKAFRTKKLNRFGYVNLEPLKTDFCLRGVIKGHEFHYWESTDPGQDWIAGKPLGTKSWNCMHSREGQIMGFAHLYYPSNPEFLRKWLDLCKGRRMIRKQR